jgi:hypothetical protein
MYQNPRSGFTRVELLVTITTVSLATLVTGCGLASARANEREVEDGRQLNQTHKGWLIMSTDYNDIFPTPGLVNRCGNTPGKGPEDQSVNSHANLFAATISAEYATPEILVSPSEASANVAIATTYDIEAYSPPLDQYWDTNAFSRFKADLDQICNTSYGTCLLFGDRKSSQWRKSLDSKFAVIGNRGVENSSYDDDTYLSSKTLQIHGGRKEWVGNICFNDNHVKLTRTFAPSTIAQINDHGMDVVDTLFAEDVDRGGEGGDVFLCITDTGSATGGDCTTFDWESALSWD